MNVAGSMRQWPGAVFTGLLVAVTASAAVGQQVPQVRAVLFYSPTCPHCHQVMTEDLPPLLREFGDRLQIVTISTLTPTGERLYLETVRELAIPDERTGVPALIVGSTLLVGSSEIPAKFPGMVKQGLAAGGVDWPAVPGIRELLVSQGLMEVRPAAPAAAPQPAGAPGEDAVSARARADASPSAAQPAPPASRPAGGAAAIGAAGPPASRLAGGPAAPGAVGPPTSPSAVPPAGASEPASAGVPAESVPAPTDQAAAAPVPGVDLLGSDGVAEPGMLARFRTDPAGNGVAVAALFLMLLALGAVAAAAAGRLHWRAGPEWLTPLLVLAGTGVALYLSYVELTGATAVCGPVGDCNTVQQSPYARVAGLVPMGVIGVLGYLVLLAAWTTAAMGRPRYRPFARVVLWGAALLGTVCSVYLTFLEPFVIGASCAWCITSALVMTVLLLLATPAALAVRAAGAAARTI